ncbi:MAG: HNH endonuclease [Spirochaetales bacterium]
MFKFSIFTINGDFNFSIDEENESTISFYYNLLYIFSDIDSTKKTITLICIQQMNKKIKEDIKKLVEKFETANIKMRTLVVEINSIKEGEFFFVFPEIKFNVKQIITFNESLRLLNKGIPLDKLEEELKKPIEEFESIFKEILENYEINVIEPRKKKIFGEIDKEKRICKYCGKSNKNGASFKEEAHAIPESLGNRTIISAEECDECNARFSTGIELDVFEYLKVFRVLYGKSGKDGIPKLKFKNGIEISYNNGKAIIIDKTGSNKLSINNFKIPLEYYHEMNLMNIYRGLVKFAIGVLPINEIKKLSATIKWITDVKNDSSSKKLPPVASMIDKRNYYEQPNMVIYKKISDKCDLPYMYVELKIAFIIFVYIIPFADDDNIDYSIQENYDKFWSINKHYNHFGTWTYNQFDYDGKRPFIMNLNFKEATST